MPLSESESHTTRHVPLSGCASLRAGPPGYQPTNRVTVTARHRGDARGPDPEIPESRLLPRPGPDLAGFPDPDWAGIGKILGILIPIWRLGRDPGKSGNPDWAGIGKIAGITPRLTGIRIGIGTQ